MPALSIPTGLSAPVITDVRPTLTTLTSSGRVYLATGTDHIAVPSVTTHPLNSTDPSASPSATALVEAYLNKPLNITISHFACRQDFNNCETKGRNATGGGHISHEDLLKCNHDFRACVGRPHAVLSHLSHGEAQGVDLAPRDSTETPPFSEPLTPGPILSGFKTIHVAPKETAASPAFLEPFAPGPVITNSIAPRGQTNENETPHCSYGDPPILPREVEKRKDVPGRGWCFPGSHLSTAIDAIEKPKAQREEQMTVPKLRDDFQGHQKRAQAGANRIPSATGPKGLESDEASKQVVAAEANKIEKHRQPQAEGHNIHSNSHAILPRSEPERKLIVDYFPFDAEPGEDDDEKQLKAAGPPQPAPREPKSGHYPAPTFQNAATEQQETEKRAPPPIFHYDHGKPKLGMPVCEDGEGHVKCDKAKRGLGDPISLPRCNYRDLSTWWACLRRGGGCALQIFDWGVVMLEGRGGGRFLVWGE